MHVRIASVFVPERGMYGRQVRVWWGDLKERDHLKDLGID